MDYIFRRLALDYLDFETRQSLGIYSAEERQRYLETGYYEPLQLGEGESLKADVPVEADDRRGRALFVGRARERSERCRHPEAPKVGGQAGAHLRRALRADHRHRRRLPALHDLRHQDAPRRFVLRVRRLRKYERVQLTR